MEKTYWKGIEELEQSKGFVEQLDKEFSDDLPILASIKEPISTEAKTNRRDFLKMLGFSVTAAAIASACEMPVRRSIPYALKPEEVTPGVANYYATTMFQGGDFAPVLVKTREGRPIKIDANKLSVVSGSGTSARVQASVLSLYDGARYTGPRKGKEKLTWEKVDTEIAAILKDVKDSGGKVAIFSSTIPSPSTNKAIEAFATANNADHLVYDAISYSGILDANQQTFGVRTIPSYSFDKANVIVSVGCDFLSSWLSPDEFASAWAKNRKVTADKPNMSKHIQIESVLTLTGSNADTRVTVKPNEENLAIADLYKAVTGAGTPSNPKVASAAKALLAAKGSSLVVCGSNDASVQVLVNAINQSLGNYGNTISFANAYNTKNGDDKAGDKLIEGLNNGTYKAVVFYESNPLLTLPNSAKLAEALKKAKVSISFSNRMDETSESCTFVCPDSHWLESWNDFSPKVGVYNTAQPTISKLFDTRQAQSTLLKWAGQNEDYYTFLQANSQASVYPNQTKVSGFEGFWDVAIHDGEVVTNVTLAQPSFSGSADQVLSDVASKYAKGGDIQVKLYESVSAGNGFWADNPFLQELPDPITKACWDNVLTVPVEWAKKNDILNDLELKKYTIVKVTANGKSVELPAVAVPGQANGSFGIALGYGKTVANHDELKVGVNAYPMAALVGNNFSYIANATIEKTSKIHELAITQTHHNITLKGLGGIKKRLVVKETTLPEYKANPSAGNTDRAHIQELMVTLYNEHEKAGHHWTMTIDLNSCIGCGACVTACNIENNVPVVGKDQVIRSREMHWLRIDRYFTYTEMIQGGAQEGPTLLDPDKIDIVYQPMMCQHCDNAPCENVCPVAATNHSSEGLNQMAYNRCIGTRYCANNCPYKVRRFNWYDYQAADSFNDSVGSMWVNEGPLSGVTRSLNEPLTRMVLNPDVTVRSRGVIEKCSFCVQKLQDAKLTAKKENRPLKDGDATTACATACATNAITFGDRNDTSSLVYKALNDERTFGVIEEIHTMPNVLYLTKVRNREAESKA